MYLRYVDRAATKNDIRDSLILIAHENGEHLSDARADKLANKFKKGLFDPDLAKYIQYSDPVGEEAVRNVMKELIAA